ncbi:hypothetical protein GCM10023354_05350 [Garicola koreensis]|nr:glycosyltransferase [Garicola koreensis]
MENSLVQQARKQLDRGEYSEALKTYLLLENEHNTGLFRGNITLCRERLRRADSARRSVGDPVPIQDIYRTVAAGEAQNPRVTRGPLVSVIVTAHNTEKYIESSLESLKAQTYQDLEIIVVSDASTDCTDTILERVRRATSGIKVYRLAANLGTYYAKNFGIRMSSGEYIFFQDSDDVSHHDRIAYGMGAFLSNPGIRVVRSQYSRVDPTEGLVVRINGVVSKLGLITLGIRREIFDEVGLFNCTTKASDDEMFNRLKAKYDRASIRDVKLPLYYNTMREGSLFADMVKWDGSHSIDQNPSPSRAEYARTFSELHTDVAPESLPEVFSFPRVRDALPVPCDMTKLPNPEIPVVVNVCSIPSRARSLRTVVESLAPQCDRICVYLDGYENTPPFLHEYGSQVKVRHSSEHPGLRDNGKFIELDRIVGEGAECYYFTVDDDIHYPPDYVAHMLLKLKEYDESVVAGAHGVIMKRWPKGYFSDQRLVFSFTKGLERDKAVNLLGTGTMAFRSSVLSEFSLKWLENAGMADIYWAVICRNRQIPLVCVERHAGWMRDLGSSGETLYQEFRGRDPIQAETVISNAPWSYASIAESLECSFSDRRVIEFLLPSLQFHHELLD